MNTAKTLISYLYEEWGISKKSIAKKLDVPPSTIASWYRKGASENLGIEYYGELKQIYGRLLPESSNEQADELKRQVDDLKRLVEAKDKEISRLEQNIEVQNKLIDMYERERRATSE